MLHEGGSGLNFFFDTSALVKLFHRENGSAIVEKIHQDNDISVSELALTEFYSATMRKFREKLISEHDLREILRAFDEQMTYIAVEPISRAVIEESKNILQKTGKKYQIRSLDAIQLATFNLIADNKWTFVSTDMHLLGAAHITGIKTINPDKG
jgi:predicted nucleic acid-binding protein